MESVDPLLAKRVDVAAFAGDDHNFRIIANDERGGDRARVVRLDIFAADIRKRVDATR